MQSSIDQFTTVFCPMPMSFIRKKIIKSPVKNNQNSSDLYFHIVLKTDCKNISDLEREKIHKYIIGYIRATAAKVKIIGSVRERIHLLVGLPQSRALADFVRELKLVSKTFARRKLNAADFLWREEYDAFTVSSSQIKRVHGFIRRQVQLGKQEKYASSWQPVSVSKLY